MTDPANAKPPLAVSSIILSMALIAISNGLLFAYIPVKLAESGFAPWVAGSMITALAFGCIFGCLFTSPLVRRVGHARVFASLAAMIILAALGIALDPDPLFWVLARFLYGFAMAGLFVVSQSWLNDACTNAWRGRVVAVFYMAYVLCIGFGSYLLTFISLEGKTAPLVSLLFAALAVLPASLTRLHTPPPPEGVAIAIRRVWKISPVAFAGALAVGGLAMLVQGFTPIYFAAENYAKSDIALLLFLMQLGMIGVQYPLGALSDRMDRRYLLIVAAAIIVVSAIVASFLDNVAFAWIILVFAIWTGATESIFAIANAQANDRADPKYFVAVSSTLMVAWSVSGFAVPFVTTLLTGYLGPKTFMAVAAIIAAAYGLFAFVRVRQREAVPEAETEPFQPASAQAPYSTEIWPEAQGDESGA